FDGGRPPEHVRKSGASVLFDREHDQERWDVRWRQGQMEIVRLTWADGSGNGPEPDESDVPTGRSSGDRAVILAIERGGRTLLMTAGLSLKNGDRAAVAIYSNERDDALRALRAAGWQEPTT